MTMERRAFLKLIAVGAGAVTLPLSFPAIAAAGAAKSVAFGGALYRAGANGKILASSNGGSTWQLHTDLGEIYTISKLAVERNRLRITVGYRSGTFGLALASDNKRWLTS